MGFDTIIRSCVRRASSRALALALVSIFVLAAPAPAENDLAQRVERLSTYSTGATRVDLVALENAARGADEARRAELEALYIGLLDGEHTADAREFALRQLKLVGTTAAVPALKRFVASSHDSQLAVDALASIGGSIAIEAIVDATLSLGEDAPPEAVACLEMLVASADESLTAFRIGDRAMEGVMSESSADWSWINKSVYTDLIAMAMFRELGPAGFVRAFAGRFDGAEALWERSLKSDWFADALVQFAASSSAEDEDARVDRELTAEIGRSLWSHGSWVEGLPSLSTAPSPQRLRGLEILALLEPDQQTGRLLLLLEDEDSSVAGLAERLLAESVAESVVPLIGEAAGELGAAARVRATRVLAAHGGHGAIEALNGLAMRGDIFAVDALGTIDDTYALTLLSLLSPPKYGSHFSFEGWIESDYSELGRAISERAFEVLCSSPFERTDAFLLRGLAERDDYKRNYVGQLWAYAKRLGPDSTPVLVEIVRAEHADLEAAAAGRSAELQFGEYRDRGILRAAWEALTVHASPAEFDALAALIEHEMRYEDEAATALVVALERARDPRTHSKAAIEAYRQSEGRAREILMPALALIGDAAAMAEVKQALLVDASAPVAVDTLGSWPDGGALEPLLVTFTSGAEDLRAPAFDAALRLGARLGVSDPTAAGGVVTALWAQAKDAAERERVLALAGTVPNRFAADVVRKALRGGDAVGAAVDAAVALAPRLAPTDRYAATELLDAATRAASTADRTAAIDAAFDAVDADEDFLLAWRLAGPFEKSGVQGAEIMAERFAPEIDPDDPAIVWRDLFASEHAGRGIFDLNALLNATNATAYVRTHLWSARAQSVRLELGSDDGLCVWLNGAEIHRNDAQRGLSVGSDVVVAKLEAGWNTLMLEVTQGGGDWAFCCRLRGTDRRAASGWRCDRFPRDTAPPAGAVVLVGEGAGLDAWQRTDGELAGWTLEGGVLACVPGTGNVRSREEFGDATIHVEFAVPHEPDRERGQGQGNSGVYAQGRYEVQVLNSFGLPPHPNECGSIYGVAAPTVNMAARPGEWQTYDIEFTAARWAGGTKVSDARLTVLHNGVLIHDDVTVPGSTGAGAPEMDGPGPLVFQDHGHELRFRNVWVLPHDRELGADAVSLVSGDGLDGWVQRGGDAVYRRDGDAIVGETRPNQPNSFLCTQSDYGDFVLELEFLVDSELNSGVQVRSLALDEVMGGRVHGYQVEIDPGERAWTAGIYDESRRGWLAPLGELDASRAAFRDDQWNRLRVYARGDVLRTWLNGQPCAVLVDGMTPRGFIGLQVHGVGGREDALEVRWRGLRLAEF
jgi:hypothetical protein